MPCIVRETSDAETMEIALIENLQRKDLSPFEEADGLKALAESYGYTHEQMAEKLGKSRTLDHRDPQPDARCPRTCASCVGWPTFSPSHCCCSRSPR